MKISERHGDMPRGTQQVATVEVEQNASIIS